MSKQQQQQPPLPQQIVLGLNAWNCKSKISNANWETNLNEQVNINNGDSIFVKASYIDTRGTASGNIDLNVDTVISLDYYFYWIHTFNACNGRELISQPTADGPTNLVQQVLVGRDILNLYTQNAILNPNNPVPAYPTVPDATNGYWNSTGINDADALPYIVYQSTNKFPVPAIFGPIIPASQIPTGAINLSYVINTAGITTNWEYAGVPGATKNILPPDWILNTDSFLAINNPNGLDVPALQPLSTNPGMPVSAFLLPADVNPTLPYVSYIITSLGDTVWEVIDPDLFDVKIPASDMVQGAVFTIDVDVGSLDWTYWGSPNNNPGQSFTCSQPPPLQSNVAIVLNTAFFVANKNLYNSTQTGSLPFGQPDDVFECTVGFDSNGNWIDITFSGSGTWCFNISNAAEWVIPATTISPFLNGTNCGDLIINNFTSGAGKYLVDTCLVGVSYVPNVAALGVVDGSNPQFTWAQISNGWTTANTYEMYSGSQYQVVPPDEGWVIPYAPNQGVISDIFVSQGNTGIPDSYYNLQSQVAITIISNTGKSYPLFLMPVFDVTVHFDDATLQYIWGAGSKFGSPDSRIFDADTTSITLTIPFNSQSTNRIPLVFTASIAAGQMTLDFVVDMTCITTVSPGNLILFPTVPEPQRFVCDTLIPASQNSTAEVDGSFVLETASFSGTGFQMGFCFAKAAKVGTVFKSLNAGTGTGLAVLAPSQYDGTVKSYAAPTYRTDIRPVKKRWSMTLPKGSYDPNYLAELISRNMSRQKVKRVNNVQGAPFGTQSTFTVPTDSAWNNLPPNNTNIWTQSTGSGQNTFYDSKNPIAYDFPSGLDYNLAPDNFDDMPFLFTPALLGTPLHNNSNPNDYVYAAIPHPNSRGLNNLPLAPIYNINLVPLLSDVRSVSTTIPPSANTTDPYYSILPFYSQNNRVFGATDSGNAGIFPVTFGATQTSLLYNNENNSLFSFNYLHSPILAYLSSTSTELTECTAHMYVTNKKSTNMNNTNYFTSLIDKKSGVLLNKMEPASFWTQLGFDIPALTVDLDNQIGFQMTADEFQAKTTGGFCGSSNIFNQTFKTVGSADQPNVADTELLFTTAVPPVNPDTIIEAYAPNLTIGTQYVVVNGGTVDLRNGPGTDGLPVLSDDWNNYVGFLPVEMNGQPFPPDGNTFTATSTGFPTGSIDFTYGRDTETGYWNQSPTVYLANLPPAVTTTQLANSYYTVNNTNTLNASAIPTQRDSTGHYLLEITGYNSVYLDDNSKHEIKSVISSYYVSANSFVSQPFPDSYNFFNYGAPISLSNIKVRILDPYTMEEANIGPNSSVYLQINKLLSDQATQQLEN